MGQDIQCRTGERASETVLFMSSTAEIFFQTCISPDYAICVGPGTAKVGMTKKSPITFFISCSLRRSSSKRQFLFDSPVFFIEKNETVYSFGKHLKAFFGEPTCHLFFVFDCDQDRTLRNPSRMAASFTRLRSSVCRPCSRTKALWCWADSRTRASSSLRPPSSSSRFVRFAAALCLFH